MQVVKARKVSHSPIHMVAHVCSDELPHTSSLIMTQLSQPLLQWRQGRTCKGGWETVSGCWNSSWWSEIIHALQGSSRPTACSHLSTQSLSFHAHLPQHIYLQGNRLETIFAICRPTVSSCHSCMKSSCTCHHTAECYLIKAQGAAVGSGVIMYHLSAEGQTDIQWTGQCALLFTGCDCVSGKCALTSERRKLPDGLYLTYLWLNLKHLFRINRSTWRIV